MRNAGDAWMAAIQQVQDSHRQQRHNESVQVLSSNDLSVPSIIEEHQASLHTCAVATPRLAIMVHAALHLPGSRAQGPSAGSGDNNHNPNHNHNNNNSSSSSGGAANTNGDSSRTNDSPAAKPSSDCYYVKVGLCNKQQRPPSPLLQQQEQKTARAVQAGSSVQWPQGLLLLEPHGQLQGLEVVLRLKRKGHLLGQSVVVGSVRVPLKAVEQAPQQWGTKQQLLLSGHKAEAAGTVLEVQMFLSTSTVPSPLRVLAGTWNVGNALPPPPTQLHEWLKGAQEGEHHLVAVAAQECSYAKEMRQYVTQQRRNTPSPAAAAVAAAADDTPILAAAAASATAVERAPSSSPTAAAAEGAAVTVGDAAPQLEPSCTRVTTSQVQPSRTAEAASTRAPRLRQTQSLPPAEAAATAAASELQQAQSLPPGTATAEAAAAADNDDWLQSPQHLGSTRAALKAKLVDAVDSSVVSWERLISSALGDKYWLVGSQHMFQTRLLLFGRGDMVPFISHLCSGFEATGIGHVGVNKGGVAIGLKVGATSIVFVGAHLAAHQSKVLRRNTDVGEICRELNLQEAAAVAGADLVTGFHHVVWMGDLNYRLEYGQQALTQADSPTPEDFASMCQIISQHRFDELLPLDQLRREREVGRVFSGFSEGRIAFAPTFKVKKGEAGCQYAPKRSPAWCDRVLFKSALPHKRAACECYFAAEDITSSDHKPVAAVLALPTSTSGLFQSLQRSSSLGSSPFSTGSSWSAAAAATLARFSVNRHRSSSTASSLMLYKLQLASVCLSDQQTWYELAGLIDRSRFKTPTDSSRDGGTAAAAAATGSLVLPSGSGVGAAAGVNCSSSSTNSRKALDEKRKLKLQLLVTGTCSTGGKQSHVTRLSPEAVQAARTAEQQPNLLLHDDSIQLRQGSLSQLADNWLLLQVVLVQSWGRQQTLARGILPLQAVIAAYRSHHRAVAVPVQLENSSAAVGTLVVTARLVSCASIRAGMHEAIRRMRALASTRRRTQLASTGSDGLLAATPAADALHIDRGLSAPPGSISRVGSS